MKKLFLVVLLLALAGTTQAIDIKGKWGLGVGTGDFIGSRAEASLIRGKTERTAWILDLNLYNEYRDMRNDSTGRMDNRWSQTNITLGPRIRRYTRPQAKLSPYFDVFLHLSESGYNNTNSGTFYAGGEFGFEGGAEYFTPWYFSLCAHSGIFTAAVERAVEGAGGRIKARGWRERSMIGFSPRLQIRVYF